MFWIFIRFFTIIWEFIAAFSSSFWFIIEKASYVFTIGFYVVKLIANFRPSKKNQKKVLEEEVETQETVLHEKKPKIKKRGSSTDSKPKKRKTKK